MTAWQWPDGQWFFEQRDGELRATATAPMTTTCEHRGWNAGAGEHDVSDSYLRVVDSNGRLVTYNDDGGSA